MFLGRVPACNPRPDEISYKALIRGCCLLDETQKSLGGIKDACEMCQIMVPLAMHFN